MMPWQSQHGDSDDDHWHTSIMPVNTGGIRVIECQCHHHVISKVPAGSYTSILHILHIYAKYRPARAAVTETTSRPGVINCILCAYFWHIFWHIGSLSCHDIFCICSAYFLYISCIYIEYFLQIGPINCI